MSSRRTSTRFAVTLAAGTLLASGAGFAISACSSSTTDVATAADASGDVVARDSFRPPPPDQDSEVPTPDAGETLDQCLAKCNTAHPNSTAKETAIDTCWMSSCQGPCIDDPPTAFDAGEAGIPDAGPDAMPACGTGVTSGVSVDCDNCTEANCCAAWTGCFNDTDCSDLDQCIGACYTAHP